MKDFDYHWNRYATFLEQEKVFAACANASTLEIGPLEGKISKLIQKHSPKEHITVEPDRRFKATHHRIYEKYLHIEQRSFDVVVCMGVLYHLHSPFDMIEKIIEINKPKTFIVETIDVGLVPRIEKEDINTIGNAWDTIIPYNINIPIKYYQEVICAQGYRQTKHYDMADHLIKNVSKRRQVLMVFNR